jgi:predicted AlkP superfamily pyrophosphatase or phosphodiesterase
MRKFILAAVSALFATGSLAQPQPAPPPKLLVVIAIDQFSANLFDEYRPQFTAGFARLAQGTVFRNGYQSHANTETCPGHSTILTGDHPSRTGIVQNSWIDQSIARADKTVYCAEDETVPGTSSTHYVVSPKHLLVPTMGELMKQRWPDSRSVAVSGKDRAAVMMGGHRPDQRWYWNGQAFVTDLSGVTVPQTIVRANAAIAAALAQPRPGLQPPPFCQSKSKLIALPGNPSSVGAGAFERKAGDADALRASPELDGDTLAVAAGLVDEMQLGRHADPDLLAISLSATDYIGHGYGTEGQEMCLNLLELDRELGDFFAQLDSRHIDYEVALTADHGGKDIPERERLAGVTTAQRVDPALAPGTMGKKLVAELGLQGPGLLGSGPFSDIYVDRRLAPADRKRLLAAAVAAYTAHPQVEAVFTAAEIARTPVPTGSPVQWTLLQRVRASYYPGRSGDFFVVLKKDVTPISSPNHYIATHGSPWDYDRRVPILFWRSGAAGTTIERAVESTDIMPTLASEIGLPLAPASIDGHCLPEVAGAVCAGR